ncbi:MAG: hypothetical protein PUI31_01195, partial [Clostridia bacterium]|nr:hypothetical protein [Clostridia bacterium]
FGFAFKKNHKNTTAHTPFGGRGCFLKTRGRPFPLPHKTPPISRLIAYFIKIATAVFKYCAHPNFRHAAAFTKKSTAAEIMSSLFICFLFCFLFAFYFKI